MNRGLYAKARRRLPEAIAYLQRAVSLAGGTYPDASHNLALNLLAVGKIEEGYQKYRDRWATSQFAKDKRGFRSPNIGSPRRRTPISWCLEQGMGDEVLYSWICPG